MSDLNPCIGCSCACFVCILVIILLSGFKSLEEYQVGLEFNPLKNEVDSTTVYTSGLQYLGPFHRFIIFDNNQKTIQMGDQSGSSSSPDLITDVLTSRTSDAGLVDVYCSFQYKLQTDADDLIYLFKTFGEEYQDAFVKIARSILRNVIAEYEAIDFFYDRSSIESALEIALTDELYEYRADVQSFQLLDIELPYSLNQALINTEDLNLEIDTTEFKKAEAEELAVGTIAKAQQEAEVIVNEASAYAAEVKQYALGLQDSIIAKIDSQKDVLADIKSNAKFSNAQLAAFYFYEVLDLSAYSSKKVNIPMSSSLTDFFSSA